MDYLKAGSVLIIIIFCISCSQNRNPSTEETINSGTLFISVDESLKPLMEAEFTVFSYLNPKARLVISYKPEKEVMAEFKSDSTKAVILARELNSDEMNYFRSISFIPRALPFAKDGITILVNAENKKDSFTMAELKLMLTGNHKWNELGGNINNNVNVVFDNQTSSAVRWIQDSIMKRESFSSQCFAVNSNPEVIRYVMEHENAVGIIGNSWVSDLDDSNVVNALRKVKKAKIALSDTAEYLQPFQSEIETGRYPLSRMIYTIQRDGKVGLGTGVQRFLYDERGQLIVLKFGMMPYRQPERSVEFKQ
jgi:phosphate transport system substrate-binding protein